MITQCRFNAGPTLCQRLVYVSTAAHPNNTTDLVIFACLDFREYANFGLFVKPRIRKLSISMIVALLFISEIREFFLVAKFAKIKTLVILPDLQ